MKIDTKTFMEDLENTTKILAELSKHYPEPKETNKDWQEYAQSEMDLIDDGTDDSDNNAYFYKGQRCDALGNSLTEDQVLELDADGNEEADFVSFNKNSKKESLRSQLC